MLYRLMLKFEAYHVPSGSWHVYETPRGVRAVSSKHALNKGLKVVMNMPGYRDREGHPDWKPLEASATIVKPRLS